MALKPHLPADWLAPESAADEPQFWRDWLRQAAPALGATCAMIVRPARNGQPERVVLRAGEQRRDIPVGLVDDVADGGADTPLRSMAHELGGGTFALRLPWDEASDAPLVVVGEVPASVWNDGPDAAWNDRALLWATAAARRRRTRELAITRRRADELAGALELAAMVREHRSFKAAALEVCNQLAARHQADRVALGWWREPYVRLSAISQLDRIEDRMTAVGEVESAMEEAIEQDAMLIWPAPHTEGDGDDDRSRAEILAQHSAFARAQGWAHLCTVPLRSGRRILGAVTWHRQDRAFLADEAESFALVLDALGPLLEERERNEGWWGRRWKRRAEEALRRHANLQHPWAKLGAIGVALVFAASLLVHVPYRVEADFAVQPVRQMVFSAPFDGFVKSVAVAPADFVREGGELFALHDTALRLEEGELLADLSRYARERELAEAKRELAGMRVATAQRDQVAARLERLRRQIGQTVARAPFGGVVLDDGNLRERLGAPVREGDSLLRFAQLDGLYFELAVPEADAPLMQEGRRVEIAFRSRPDQIVAAVVTRIEPEAVVRDAGAVFIVRAAPEGAPADWWRPGMTGIGKVITERRSLFDIFTRRLRDWLRLQLWW